MDWNAQAAGKAARAPGDIPNAGAAPARHAATASARDPVAGLSLDTNQNIATLNIAVGDDSAARTELAWMY